MQDTSRLIYSGGRCLPSLWNWLASGSKFLFHQFLNLCLWLWMVSLPRQIAFHNPRNFWPPWWFVVMCFLRKNPHKESVCLFSFTFVPFQSSSSLHQVICGSLLGLEEKELKRSSRSVSKLMMLYFSICISLTFHLDCFILVQKKAKLFSHFCRINGSPVNLPCELLWSQVWG